MSNKNSRSRSQKVNRERRDASERLGERRDALPHRDVAQALRSEISAIMPQLSGPLFEAAQAVLENPIDVALLSMRTMAAKSNVSPVSMVRFAQQMGLPGYNALRKVFADEMKRSVGNNLQTARQIATSAHAHGLAEFVKSFFDAERAILSETQAYLTLSSLKETVDILVRAQRIYLIAWRSTLPVAEAMTYSLRKVRGRVILLNTTGGAPETELLDCNHEDVLVAISFPAYSRLTLSMARQAAASGARIVSITDKISAPIAAISTHVFPTRVHSSSFPESMIGAYAMTNLLVSLVVSELGDRALDRIAESDRRINENDEWIFGAKTTRKMKSKKQV